jgi:hypothetical protein
MCKHDFDGGVVLVQVDSAHEHGCVADMMTFFAPPLMWAIAL